MFVSIDVFDVFKKLKSFKVSISIQEQKLINNFRFKPCPAVRYGLSSFAEYSFRLTGRGLYTEKSTQHHQLEILNIINNFVSF